MPQPAAVLYARVSSKEQEKEGFSIPAQQKLLRQYASDHGIVVSCEMLAYLRRHSDCRTILVEKTDRLYRNIKDWVTIDELGVFRTVVLGNSTYERSAAGTPGFPVQHTRPPRS